MTIGYPEFACPHCQAPQCERLHEHLFDDNGRAIPVQCVKCNGWMIAAKRGVGPNSHIVITSSPGPVAV